MKSTLLQGWCHRGLYYLPSGPSEKQVFSVAPSFARWHGRLGHPSTPIVTRIISNNKLPCLAGTNKDSVCDACQKAKSHQLSYSRSSSISHYSLELVHSDVWGPTPDSVGRKKIVC